MSPPPHGDVVVLAGGTGGAKLARGILDVVGPERLAVIANTGDDVEIYGAHVSPDPDLVSFWLADLIDDRGWGLAGDTFNVMDGLRALGVEVWFNLGDRDLAWCLERARLTGALAAGARDATLAPMATQTTATQTTATQAAAQQAAAQQAADAHSLLSDSPLSPTAALARLNDAIGVGARVLPMCDEPVRTWIRSTGRWWAFQEFMIRERAAGPVEGVELRGIEQARSTPEALAAIAGAGAIVIGPSNPVISIDPILSVPGMRDALRRAAAPVVAVSPVVGGEVLKGPTAAFMAYAGRELSAGGVAEHYSGLIDGIVSDEAVDGVPALQTDIRMSDGAARAGLAERVLAFADSLRP